MELRKKSFAVIDIGSNSTRLLVASLAGGMVRPAVKEVIYTRLSQGLSTTSILSEKAMDRTITAVNELKSHAHTSGVEAVFAFATASVRNAENRDVFIRRMHKETSLLLDVLSEEREAQMGFMGCFSGGMRGMVDIGGGSTELALGEGLEMNMSISMPLGAVKAAELYPLGDIADDMTLLAMHQWASHELRRTAGDILIAWQGMGSPRFDGVGGTITTLACMDMSLEHYKPNQIQGHELTLPAVESMIERLAQLPLEKRLLIPGLQKERADTILGGAVIVKQFMGYMGIKSIFVSDRDNLEGYFYAVSQRE